MSKPLNKSFSAFIPMKITFPDGNSKEFKKGATGLEIAKAIGERLAQAALAIEVNGKLQNLSVPVEKDAKIRIITFKDPEGVEIFRHSSAHLLAHAVVELFPEAKITIGPVVEEGFYYDIDHPPFKQEDLERIEQKMKEIVDKKLPVERIELAQKQALEMFKNNPYKIELIKEIKAGEKISAYKQGNFVDLCSGPHVPNTSYLKAFKLTKLAAAYWKGDAKNKQLQRIYGISFPDKKTLDEFLKQVEDAEKYNHNKIGEELGLFAHFDLIGKGLPVWLPKGDTIRREIENFAIAIEDAAGYVRVSTPHIAKKELFLQSGHLPYYEHSMYPVMKIDDGDYYLKAMNCPLHHLIFSKQVRSYRDLPYRIAEYGTVYRNELSGTLTGLLRVRAMKMNDAHIYCTKEQIEKEIENVLMLIKKYYDIFGLNNYSFRLSLRDAHNKTKYIDEPKSWDYTEEILRSVLKKLKVQFVEAKDEAAFYGPKIDVQFKNVYGREETMSTIQLDFAAKKRFDLHYDDDDGTKNNDVFVIHRAPLSTHERFIALLIEHYKGKFPLWLNPNQVKILPIADRHVRYAEAVAKTLSNAGVRVEVDKRVESTPKKVRDAQIEQFNYILVVGDKEEQNKTVNVRTRDNVVHGEKKVDILLTELTTEIKNKK